MASAESQLAAGVGQLGEGQETISDTLSSAGESLSAVSASSEERAEAAAAPVSLTTEARNRVSGSAQFAPVVLAAVLWLGALLSVAVVPPLDERVLLAGRALSATLSNFVVAVGVSLAQALVASLAVFVATGSVPANVPAFCVVVVLAALSFASVGQGIRALSGRAALPVLVLLLALQLVCAGSVLPGAFTGGVFAALGQVLPMPVLTEALRDTVSGSLAGAGGACAVLVVWTVAGLAASMLAARARTNIRPERAFA